MSKSSPAPSPESGGPRRSRGKGRAAGVPEAKPKPPTGGMWVSTPCDLGAILRGEVADVDSALTQVLRDFLRRD